MSNQDAPKQSLTSNEIAAGGPIPGNLSLVEQELAKVKSATSPGFFPSLNAAEVADASRSAFFPGASYTGSFEGPNQVYAWRSADQYQGCTYLGNRRPGELYIIGGGASPPWPLHRKGRCYDWQGNLAHICRQWERHGTFHWQWQPEHSR